MLEVTAGVEVIVGLFDDVDVDAIKAAKARAEAQRRESAQSDLQARSEFELFTREDVPQIIREYVAKASQVRPAERLRGSTWFSPAVWLFCQPQYSGWDGMERGRVCEFHVAVDGSVYRAQWTGESVRLKSCSLRETALMLAFGVDGTYPSSDALVTRFQKPAGVRKAIAQTSLCLQQLLD